MDLFLIRHTTPDIASGTCYGQKNIGLTDHFLIEQKEIVDKLPSKYKTFGICSSPLKRCHTLASKFRETDVLTDPRLMELDFGDWEGQKWDDINDEELASWMENFVEVACPGGESYRQLYERVIDWWEEIIITEQEQLLVVTHSGAIRCLVSHVLGIPLENSFRLTIDYGSVSKIIRDNNRNSIAYLNR